MGKYIGVLVGIVIGALAAVAWVATAQEAETESAEASQSSDRYAELEKTRGNWQETWVLPGADFTKFSKVYLWDPEFQFRDVGPARRTRSTMLHTHKREFGMFEEDKQKFEEVVTEAFMKEMNKGKQYELVDAIGPETLILRGAFLDIVSRVPPETVGRSDVYLSTIGEATFVMELLDSDSGVVLALVAERRAIQPPGGQISTFSTPTNRVTVIADVRRWSTQAAAKMRGALDKAIKG